MPAIDSVANEQEAMPAGLQPEVDGGSGTGPASVVMTLGISNRRQITRLYEALGVHRSRPATTKTTASSSRRPPPGYGQAIVPRLGHERLLVVTVSMRPRAAPRTLADNDGSPP